MMIFTRDRMIAYEILYIVSSPLSIPSRGFPHSLDDSCRESTDGTPQIGQPRRTVPLVIPVFNYYITFLF